MSAEDAALRVLWAKTGEGGSWHPLICHMIDVAMVARHLWREVLSPAARARLATELGLSAAHAEAWIAFWAGLHDIGKASPAFAALKSRVRGEAVKAALRCPSPIDDSPHHGEITTHVLRPLLPELGLTPALAAQVAAVVGGHHGVFASHDRVQAVAISAVGGPRWDRARRSLTQALADVLGVRPTALSIRMTNSTAMILAGLVSVADWIGSAGECFRHLVSASETTPDIDLRGYAMHADGLAASALERLRWTGWSPPSSPQAFGELFPTLSGPPRPVQQAAMALAAELDRPSLAIVEAPMGEGKTEAAMYLADHWAVSLGQSGCYFALPTQATSDQMFGRVREFLATRYPAQVVNLQLLHGHATLSAEFQALRQNADRLFEPQGVDWGRREGSQNVIAAEWFTYRKRGLLAPFGVGTVDQALLAALQTRHVFVRLFGLAHKTVIVDEVHAYDTYMTRLLERLLEWLAALGSSVVLLSATLPASRCQALAAAYMRGLGAQAASTIPQACYPRITWVNEHSAGAQHIETSREIARTLTIKWVDGRLPSANSEPFVLGEELKAALANGGCAAVICNTVGRAQQVYQALKPHFSGQVDDGWPELDLLHARYPYEERERREKRCLVRFGKPNGEVQVEEGEVRKVRRPSRAVLVATQVVEQSLDLDFDLMVSDLAPADLVLQRSGRLWRHARSRPKDGDGQERRRPELWICLPEKVGGDVPFFGGGSERVYDRHVLLRSWLALKDRTTIDVPGQVEELIEAVYADHPCPDDLSPTLRERWEETWRQYREQIERDEHEAEDRWLRRPSYDGPLWWFTRDPREEDAPDFHQAHQALTRLSEPTVQVVCLHGTQDCLCLDAEGFHPVDLNSVPDVALARQLLKRSLSISHRRVVPALLTQRVPTGWQRSPLLRHHRCLAFDADGSSSWEGYRFHLDDELGLSVAEWGTPG